jgi:hypothetical protein
VDAAKYFVPFAVMGVIGGKNQAARSQEGLRGVSFALTLEWIDGVPTTTKDASKRYHDRVARQYDAIYDDPYWAFHDELTWRMVKPHLRAT